MAGKALNSLQDLFVNELNDIIDAERQLIDAMPKMIDAAHSPRLKMKLQNHLKQTQDQAQRLEKVFSMLEMKPEPKHCDGMAGLIKEGEKVMMMHGEPAVKDAGLIAAAQKIEHYEISAYGTLRTFAHTLGRDDVAHLLQMTLEQESDTDQILTEVAESSINKKAA